MLDSHERIEGSLTFLRWALISALAYMILLGESGRTPAASHLVYVGTLLASNLIIPRVPYRNPQKFGTVLLAVDTLFVLIGVLLCDAASQDLLIAYFLCIIMATFADSQRRIAGAAALVTGVYSFWLFQHVQALGHAAILIRLPFLFITTVFYGYMMLRVRGEHARRLHAEDQVLGLDCLLQVTRLFSSSLVSAEILEQVSSLIRATLRVDRCRFHLLGSTSSQTRSQVVTAALEGRKPVLRHDERNEFPTLLALPIFHDAVPLGVLVIEGKEIGRSFPQEEVEFCQVIANAAGSALKNAEQYEALGEMDRAKSEFLSNLSHELRTPLNAIIGFSQILGEQLGGIDAPEPREMVDHVSTSAMTMLKHVENLLDLSLSTMGRERTTIGRVDLPEMLHRVVEQAEHRRREKVDFTLEIAPGIGEVYTDGEKLKRVLDNILSNAVKFTHEGSVSVRAKLVDKDAIPEGAFVATKPQPWERLLSLSVQDTGIGMDPAEVGKALRGFHQSSRGMTRQYDGLGIGLAAARRLATTLGGEIRVLSSLEQGSEFEVVVPVTIAA